MSEVSIKLFANFRELIGEKSLSLNGSTITEIVDNLSAINPDFKSAVQDESGRLMGYVTILVNGKNIKLLEGVDTALSSGDEVAIFPPVSGGE